MTSRQGEEQPTQQEAFARLAALCARAEHSTGEMRQKMRRWQMDDDAQQEVIDALVDAHFVDDARYCRMYIDDKMKFNKWGPRKIEQGLALKGVPHHTIDEGMAQIPAQAFDDLLRPLLDAKARSVKAATPYERQRKLMAFAMGRGFTPDTIMRCIGHMEE